jgi:hypothetical protein
MKRAEAKAGAQLVGLQSLSAPIESIAKRVEAQQLFLTLHDARVSRCLFRSQ